jgi:hypothetical protein
MSECADANPGAGKDRIEVLIASIEMSLEHPHAPINSLDRAGWATAIRSEMSWVLPSDIDAAATILEQRYWSEQ